MRRLIRRANSELLLLLLVFLSVNDMLTKHKVANIMNDNNNVTFYFVYCRYEFLAGRGCSLHIA